MCKPTPGAAWFLAQLVAADAEVGRHLSAGAGKVDAIISGRGGSGAELLAMETAHDLADLVELIINDFDIGFERDDGESAEAFAADLAARGEAELAKKVALLAVPHRRNGFVRRRMAREYEPRDLEDDARERRVPADPVADHDH